MKLESSGWSVADEWFWISGSSLDCCIADTCRCNAVFRNTGQTFSMWGHDDQNQGGMGPVGAVDTK